MRGPTNIDDAVNQQQARPSLVLFWVEEHVDPGFVVARAGIRPLNDYRPAKLVGSGFEIKSVESLKVRGGAVLTHGDDVDCSIRTNAEIDDWRSGNANGWLNLIASPIVGGCFSR